MSNYYLGIDVSKGYADFIILDSAKQPLDQSFQLDDTADGHHELIDYLDDFFYQHPNVTLYTAVESTGGYENNWYNRLQSLTDSLPLQVARLNPYRVKSNSAASAKHNKTDAISAKDIAEYLIAHSEKVPYNEAESYPTLRRQWNFIKLNIKQKGQLLSHLESLLYTAMPEVLSFCRNGVPPWLLKVLQKYPTYQALLKAGVEQVSKIPYISTQKAQRLIQLVKKGIGQSDPASGQIITSLTTQILNLDKMIQEQRNFLEKNYQEAQQQVELLTTFPGIGVYSAVGLLLNIVSASHFPTAKQLAAFFGVHPIYKKSGDGSWGFHMSKQGRAEVRAILYIIAWSAIQHNPLIKELYARCKRKGMHSSAALGVCMHKILRIVYGMLKNNAPFDPQIDRKNREKNQLRQHRTKIDKNRPLQQYDNNAPVSRRQMNKRKEQAQSQDEDFVKNGINEPVPIKS